ncbi:gpi anchored protein [Diplodia corticola]|uniref:Gpi anchored protein n=1 Tax=Diplodia corticola TaxID=236234 RepID=A0A1J9QKF9_9PEZI|nr:gpi anchored protein [Diplodia corticola]OJD28968.1 gpi anchored protein [Diplodia corticola]
MAFSKPTLLSCAVWLLACLPDGAVSAGSAASAPMLDLKAATKRSDTLRRTDKIRTTPFVDLLYTDGDNTNSQKSVFYSRVQAQSNKQVLVLEDIEDQLNSLECTGSGIELEFREDDVFADAENVISRLEGGYVVASHAGCTDEGSRSVFLVDDVTSSEDSKTISIATTKKQWKQAFSRFNIDYGYSQEHHELRRHQMKRRQDPTSQVATAGTATATATLELPPRRMGRRQDTISQAVTTSTATQTVVSSTVVTSTSTGFLSHQTLIPAGNASQVSETSVALNLFHESANTTFALPAGFAMTLPNPHFIIGCKHCKVTGNLNLTQGGWELDWPDMEEITEMDSVADVFKMGFVQLALNNFSAYIELQATPAESGSLQIPLFTAPTAGFRIPELGKAGVMFEPALTFNWALSGGVQMSYGFNMTIPSAVAALNFTDLESSTVTGLDDYTLTAIPFQANVSDVELQLHVALRPRIELAFGLFDDDLLAEAGTYLDLPVANVNITQLASGQHDSNCEPVDAPPAAEADFDRSFANLTHIAAGVDIGAGADFRVQAQLPVVRDPSFATSWSIASMPATTLPTACLVYQSTGAPAGAAFTPAATKFAAMQQQQQQGQAGAGGALTGGGSEAGADESFGAGRVLSLDVAVAVGV